MKVLEIGQQVVHAVISGSPLQSDQASNAAETCHTQWLQLRAWRVAIA